MRIRLGDHPLRLLTPHTHHKFQQLRQLIDRHEEECISHSFQTTAARCSQQMVYLNHGIEHIHADLGTSGCVTYPPIQRICSYLPQSTHFYDNDPNKPMIIPDSIELETSPCVASLFRPCVVCTIVKKKEKAERYVCTPVHTRNAVAHLNRQKISLAPHKASTPHTDGFRCLCGGLTWLARRGNRTTHDYQACVEFHQNKTTCLDGYAARMQSIHDNIGLKGTTIFAQEAARGCQPGTGYCRHTIEAMMLYEDEKRRFMAQYAYETRVMWAARVIQFAWRSHQAGGKKTGIALAIQTKGRNIQLFRLLMQMT